MTRLAATGLAIPGRLAATDLAVDAGERVALIGPNGSGKTSLLHAIAGVGRAAGAVSLDGVDLRTVPRVRRPRLLGYIPASRDVIWPLAVADAVMDSEASPEEAASALAALELEALAARPLDRLSTGERARAFIARALAPRPPVLLADEPIANLDPRWRLRVLNLLGRAAADGAAVLMSVHDLDVALGWATRVLVLDGGRVAADAIPDMLGPDVIARVFGVRRAGAAWVEA